MFGKILFLCFYCRVACRSRRFFPWIPLLSLSFFLIMSVVSTVERFFAVVDGGGARAAKAAPRLKPAAALPAGLAPFFTGEPLPPLWRGFFPCLIAAFLLRFYVGVSADWVVRVDELFQYLEQAHRLVFGYGQVPWEFRMGARTPLLPAITAVPLLLCRMLGADHPDFYIPAAQAWHSLLSLSIPAGMYLFTRRVAGEKIARLALLFGCFWHQLILYAPHANAEQFGAEVFFLALVLLAPAAGAVRLGAAGFLLGLTIALRLPYLPLVGVFGLMLLWAYPLRQWGTVFIGGVAAILFWGVVEYFFWGRWLHSPRLYLDMFVFNDVYFSGIGFVPPEMPVYLHFKFLAYGSFGLYALSVLALPQWRRFWVLLAPPLTVLIFHSALFNKEYSNTYIALPMLWMLIAAGVTDIRKRMKARRRKNHKDTPSWRRSAAPVAAAFAMLATLFVFVIGAPNYKIHGAGYILTPRNESFLKSEVYLRVSRELSRLPAAEVRGVLWHIEGIIDTLYLTGGYYYMHHRVPLLVPARVDAHEKLLEEVGGPGRLVSHIVADANSTTRGFSLFKNINGVGIFVNDDPSRIVELEEFSTDLSAPAPLLIEKETKRLKIPFHESPPTPLYPPVVSE